MKKGIIIMIVVLCAAVFGFSQGKANSTNDIFDKIKPAVTDIPEGFVFGVIPKYARKIIKMNPWEMDRNAIKKLADYCRKDHSETSNHKESADSELSEAG